MRTETLAPISGTLVNTHSCCFRRDDPEAATNLLRDTNRIQVYGDPDERVAAVAKEYVSKYDRAVVFAPDKTDRDELTKLIRADLYEQGRIGKTYSTACWPIRS